MIVPSKKISYISEYFFSKKMKEIVFLEKNGAKIINLGIGNPDLLPPYGVISKMKKASEYDHANTYQSYIGIEEFRHAISDWYLKIYKVQVDPEYEILPLMGSKEGIMHISMSYLDKNDQVLIPNPGYPTYYSVSKLLEAKIVYYDLHEKENWFPNIQLLESSLDLSQVKIMWVNYPHMPTGATVTLENLKKLVSFAIKHRILLVYDNPYSFILNDDSYLSIFNIKKSKIIALELNSLSKSYNMPGWRIGMVIGKREFIQNILKVKSQMDSGMYYPIQIGAIEALKHDIQWFRKINEEYMKRKKVVWEICDAFDLKYSKNSAGIFVWAKLNGLEQDDIIWSENIFHKYHIFITPGRIFGTNGMGYVRFSICCPIEILKEAKNRLCL
ncbi:pyridoxal phosphate-dependent aminotransferase [Blattabacterium cuenoti]|uniref:pyridoxal phosphate-dependent aminotransferase n=1 Tax=Blattabacterium cuenoti TaxID=1653831 RepID=UPI00163BA7FC|nr:aminotransferase class I/II-fold pyridoxal phosphate-dependent enzyme [Blattabacterium cuenoti]